MSQTGPRLKPTQDYFSDENTDPNPNLNTRSFKNQQSNNLFYNSSKAFPKQEAIFGSHYLNSQSKIQNDTFDEDEFDKSFRKLSDNGSIMNTDHSLADDSLYTLSKVGSQILTSGKRNIE